MEEKQWQTIKPVIHDYLCLCNILLFKQLIIIIQCLLFKNFHFVGSERQHYDNVWIHTGKPRSLSELLRFSSLKLH